MPFTFPSTGFFTQNLKITTTNMLNNTVNDNDNENTIYQHLWDIFKADQRKTYSTKHFYQ